MDTIRPLNLEDLPEVHKLIHELGYANDLPGLRDRLSKLNSSSAHGLYVIEEDLQVIAFMHLESITPFIQEEMVEIRALVVSSLHRGNGRGKKLLDYACHWAINLQRPIIKVQTNMLRETARAFYEKNGFVLRKTSHQLFREVEAWDT